ncbi:MAG TPA: hypothetical protein VGH45_08225 [Solirubrobacteraceae bacterium]|jgi:hypothetical protein
MRISKLRSFRAIGSLAALGVALAISACGGSSSSSTTTAAAATTQAAATTTTTPSAPKPRLKTLTPRAGAHTGSSVAVKVALIGGKATGAKPFRYVLDGHTRFGTHRVVFHGVKPGHHHLIVTLADDRSVRTQTKFVVKAPPPQPAPVVTTSTPTQTTATAPAPAPTTTAAPAPTTTAAPAPPTTTAAPPTTTAAPPPTTTSPPAGGGIPQGGGDGDGDNSGGPTDGDGNI